MTHVSQEALLLAKDLLQRWGNRRYGSSDPGEIIIARELVRLSEQKADKKWCYYCKADTHNDAECWSTRPADWIAGGAPTRLILPAGVEHKADGGGREEETNNGPAATREQHMGIGDDAESGAVPVRDNKATPEKDGSIPSGSATPSTREGVIEEAIERCARRLEGMIPSRSLLNYDSLEHRDATLKRDTLLAAAAALRALRPLMGYLTERRG